MKQSTYVALITALMWGSSWCEPTQEAVLEAMERATRFFRTEIATEGGYLWRYKEDLSMRQGEGRATETQIWIQPPGTPSVGMTLLNA